VGNTLKHIGIGNNFQNRTLMAQQIRERMNQWESIKLKRFCTVTEIVTRIKRMHTEWEKIFVTYTSD
jgi:hypothetical protein